MAEMGMGALVAPGTIFKRRFRWMFSILEVCGDHSINVLPPLKGARPNLAFKDIEIPHLIENIYIPGKPEWKPINLVLYDICPPSHNHPVWNWIHKIYQPDNGEYYPIRRGDGNTFKEEGKLQLFSGCGDVLETWIFENCWPSEINFGELDMANNEVVTCDIVLKYDRAYRQEDTSTYDPFDDPDPFARF
jgi:hypothetical protein